MWQGRHRDADGVAHRRSASFVNSRGRQPPPPPPRSAPATCRRPRRELGDRVAVTSPTAVLIEFRDENSNVVVGEKPSEDKKGVASVECQRFRDDLTRFRNRSEVDGLEWQEVDVFIGKRSSSVRQP